MRGPSPQYRYEHYDPRRAMPRYTIPRVAHCDGGAMPRYAIPRTANCESGA